MGHQDARRDWSKAVRLDMLLRHQDNYVARIDCTDELGIVIWSWPIPTDPDYWRGRDVHPDRVARDRRLHLETIAAYLSIGELERRQRQDMPAVDDHQEETHRPSNDPGV